MKILIVFGAIIACLSQVISEAAEKDVLRDACALQKDSKKRSQCFDVVERASFTDEKVSAPTDQLPETLPIAPRALTCEQYEFGELDAMKPAEMAGLYCTYGKSASRYLESARQQGANYPDNPNLRAKLLSEGIRESERCTRGMSKTGEIFRRKYPELKIDCSKLMTLPTKTN